MNPNTIYIQVPKGWVVADSEPRVPKEGEYYYSLENQQVSKRQPGTLFTYHKIIVKPEWTPPASCPKGTTFHKSKVSDTWYVGYVYLEELVKIPCSIIYSDFTPPPYSPYTVE